MEDSLGTINDYQLVERLGQGAFATVYLALDFKNKKYAVKMVETDQLDKDKIREEGMMLASMKHNNLLWARQFFFYDKEKYFVIVTDYCPDGSLDAKISVLSKASIIRIMAGIADGLRFLHTKKNIMHRDIKPQNILLDGDVAKIADLGISKMMPTKHETSVVGTENYMAPELLEGDYGYGIDIWALGVIYLELLLEERVNALTKTYKPPASDPLFPSPELLLRIEDEKYRELVSLMLVRNPKKRIDIEEVCKYFSFLEQKPEQIKKSYNNGDIIDGADVVAQIYDIFKDVIFGRSPPSLFGEVLLKDAKIVDKQSQKQNKKALFLLAKMHHEGIGAAVDIKQAEQIYLKAYALEQPHCCFQLHLITDSQREMKYYLQNGSMLNEVRCQLAIAQAYLQGKKGFYMDYQQAYDIADNLCAMKYPKAFRLRARIHSLEKTEFFNEEWMVQSLTLGSQFGDLECKLELSEHLYRKKEYEQSMKFLEQILKQQEILSSKDKLSALYTLAKCEIKLKNDQKAVNLLKKCIELDKGEEEKDYIGKLAELLEKMGEQQQAILYYNEAIYNMIPKRQNSDFFNQRLKKLCSRLYIILTQKSKFQDAFTIAELAASLGYETGRADFAYMIYSGLGVSQNREKGFKQLQELADEGNKEAIDYLLDIIDNMKE